MTGTPAVPSGQSAERTGVPISADDVGAAIRWVRERGADYNADPQDISVIGGSAGSQLGVLAARRRRAVRPLQLRDHRLPAGRPAPGRRRAQGHQHLRRLRAVHLHAGAADPPSPYYWIDAATCPAIMMVNSEAASRVLAADQLSLTMSVPLKATIGVRTITAVTPGQPPASCACLTLTKRPQAASFSIALGAGAQDRPVTDGGTSICSGCYTVVAAPAPTAMTPASVRSGRTTAITLLGSNFRTGAAVTGPEGVTVTDVVVLDEGTLTAVLSVAARPPGTGLVLTVTNPVAGGYGVGSCRCLTITR